MPHRILIRRDSFGQWHASFEDEPHTEFGGNTPGVAMLRLIAACPERAIDQNTLVAVYAEIAPDHLVFVGQGSDIIENRAQLRRVFARYR